MKNKLNLKIKIIKERLDSKGFISRNWALDRRITRLAAVINHLKGKGWMFTAGKEGEDYMYYLVTKPDEKK